MTFTHQDIDFCTKLERKYRSTLLDDVIPFWMRHSLDKEYGGYRSGLDRRGNVVDSDKAIWVQGRMAWMFSSLYNHVEQREEWLVAARSGLDFLSRHAFAQDGKMYFLVDREGRPLRMRRHFASEAFTCIAYAAYARASGGEGEKRQAERIFENFLSYVQERKKLPPKWNPDVRPMKSLSMRMITIVTAQILREDIGLRDADAAIDWAIDEIRRYFVKPEHGVVMEVVGPKGEIYDTFEGRQLNPGHAIEAAWFILKEAIYRKDDELKSLALRIIDWMWEWGWDEEYGGIFYFRDLTGKLVVQEYWHDMKFWWPHNEAEIALLLAWLTTGETRYRNRLEMLHDYQFEKFADPEFGEWFGYLHRDGRLSSELKGNHWKSGFHLPRMLLLNNLTLRQVLARPSTQNLTAIL